MIPLDLPLSLLRPFVGARIIKSGLAVFVALAAFHWIGSTYATFAAVAAILAVQPSVSRARELFRQQLLSNLLGGLVGAALGYRFGDTAWAMALAVVIVLGLCSRFKWSEAANLAVVVVLFVMDRPEHDFLPYTFARLGAVIGGMLIGYLVNRFILPPNFQARLKEELLAAAEGAARFGKRLLASLGDPEHYRKEQIKEESGAIHKRLEGAKVFLDLFEEAAPDTPRLRAVRKVHSSLLVTVERLTDIHKAALRAGGLPAGPVEEQVTDALRTVLQYVHTLTENALEERATAAGAGEASARAMAALDLLVAETVNDPLTRPLGLTLHEIKASLRHMQERMDSLNRLLLREGTAK